MGNRVVYLDCCAGVTPELILGALLDVGLDRDALCAELAALPLPAWSISVERQTSRSIAGQRVRLAVSAGTLDQSAVQVLLDACRLAQARDWIQRTIGILWGLQPQARISVGDMLGVISVATGAALLGITQFLSAPLPLTATHPRLWQLAERCAVPTICDEHAPDPHVAGIALLAGMATFHRPALRLRNVGYGIGQRLLDRPDLARLWLGELLEPLMQLPTVPSQETNRSPVLVVVTPATNGDLGAPEITALRERLREQLGQPVFVCGTDRTTPDLITALRAAVATDAQQIVVLPLLIGEAHPSMLDLAGALRWAQTTWPDYLIRCGALPLNADQIAGLLAQRAAAVLQTDQEAVVAERTVLLVLGEGSDDRQANAEVAQIARLLWEHMPAYHVTYAFVAHTRPTLDERIQECRTQGACRIVVLPLALLANQVSDHAAAYEGNAQDTEPPVLAANALLTPIGAAAVLLQRAHEALARAHAEPTRRSADPLAGTRWAAHQHPHPHPTSTSAESLLPPRYQGGVAVSAAPMGAADLQYDLDGQVAWDQIWGDFCDLALAGGPPHRGTLLEPVSPDAVRAQPEAYMRVVAELARGLRLVTSLEVLTDRSPGWIGLCCHDEAMALWMLRAIVVENVSVRREGQVLLLPAGPGFRVEAEIKNIITVVAKTHHYWTEHITGMQQTASS